MDGEELNRLADVYPPENHVELLDIAQQYRLRSEREVLEVAALASDVSFNSVTSLGLEPDANPQLLEAFELQYPRVNIESLRGQPEEFVQGYVNGVKGKYFEVLVRDGLNDGGAPWRTATGARAVRQARRFIYPSGMGPPDCE